MRLKCKKDYFYDVEPDMIRGIEAIYFIKDEYYEVCHDSITKLYTVFGEGGYYISFQGSLEFNFKNNEILREHFYDQNDVRNDVIDNILK